MGSSSLNSRYANGATIKKVRAYVDQQDGKLKDLIFRSPEKIYGFHINSNESDPAKAVTYIGDAIGMTPAHMDFVNSRFDWGSWENAFFLPRPCMLKSDGTVDYYLDPNDYTKKINGTASDVANADYDGNAMMEWGRNGKKIWVKVVPDTSLVSGDIFIGSDKFDGAEAWGFQKADGTYNDHFYTAIYNGSRPGIEYNAAYASGQKMRSISGVSVSSNLTADNEMKIAAANGSGWNIEQYCDRQLINVLMVLMTKSLNGQGTIGRGIDSGSEDAFKAYVTGSLNNKGMFFGYNDGTHAVKVFGMENYWSLQLRRTAGLMNVNGVMKYKMFPPYNTTGNDYLIAGNAPEDSTFIKTSLFGDFGILPNSGTGSSSTYYCDYTWTNSKETTFALYGGSSFNGSSGGPFYANLDSGPAIAYWFFGSALSYKP